MTQAALDLLKWGGSNWGNVLKAVALAITALGFFASLKIDIAVLKNQAANLETGSSEVNRKVDRLYDYFFNNRLGVSDNAL